MERALADIAEVRERLAMTQRFKGYSGIAAVASGVFALAAGVVQWLLVPYPQAARDGHLYFAIWFICCTASAAMNYGAIAHWFVNDASARDRWQTRTVGFAILPALVFGAVLSLAFLHNELFGYLPGVWYGCYGVGLFASRTMVPRGVIPIAALFTILGMGLLFAPPSIALAWWILPVGFGFGQIAIGVFVARDRTVRT